MALPSISKDLNASLSSLQWTVSTYSLVMACLLMLSGSMADRFGRKLIFQLGLTLFSLGSLLCGLAPSVGWLIAFVGVQAVGGSMLNPVAMSIIVSVFTDRGERARAIGVWGSAIGITMAAGPVLGGLLVSGIDWRSVFWISVPIGIAAFALSQRFVPESKATRARTFDPVGQALIIVLFASIIAATIEGPHPRMGRPRDHRADRARRRGPRRDPDRRATTIRAADRPAVFPQPAVLRRELDLSDDDGRSGRVPVPQHPLPAGHPGLQPAARRSDDHPDGRGQAVAANLSGRLVAARRDRLPLTLGGALLATGAFLLVTVTAHTQGVHLLVAYAVFGLGAGMVSPPVSHTAVSGLPLDQVGVAGALAASARQFGSAIGVAVAGSIVASSSAGFVHSSHAAWAVIGGCGVAVLALGLVSTSSWARDAAARNGQRLGTAPIPESPGGPLPGRPTDPAEARKE